MKKTNKIQDNTTEMVFILDRSGSMGGLEKDIVGGFNSLIKKQKKTKWKMLCFNSSFRLRNRSYSR